MKTAIVHDWLVTYGGAERVLEQIIKLYPEADLFALYDFIPPGQRGFIMNKPVTTSFLQKFPLAKKKYRSYLPLMPLAVEQFDLSAYDLVITINSALAKGVITGPDQLHVSYVNSPVRYAWDLTHQYLRESGLNKGLKGWLVKYILHRIRIWDAHTANGVDAMVANSKFIARRIMKVYRRESQVIYPPVDLDAFQLHTEKEDFYLTASRMVPYKKIDLIVKAFSHMPQRKLIVIGDGPDFNKIKKVAGPNVTLLGYQSFNVLYDYMRRARAFVFAAEEDFGIVPVEAQACGTPVIAFGKGGALETVRENITGLFFDRQETDCLIDAIEKFERNQSAFDPEIIRAHAENFSISRFRTEFKTFVDSAIEAHFSEKPCGSPRRLIIRGSAEKQTPSVPVNRLTTGENAKRAELLEKTPDRDVGP
ncbi:MAG: glycosyltransferase family 4 protein [FCB group bacterium]|nr:glycosyltransferase family 4 protein [FCB group bacterium]